MFPVCKITIKNSQNKKKLEKYVRRMQKSITFAF